jgi:hypothetical protein
MRLVNLLEAEEKVWKFPRKFTKKEPLTSQRNEKEMQ